MASNYPGAFDVMSDPGVNLAGPPTHSAIHNQVNDVIEAIQHALGLNPQGSFADLAARLNAGVARGVVAYAQSSGSQAISTTSFVDVTGATVTFTADPTRRYLTTLHCGRMDKDGTAGLVEMCVTDAAGSNTYIWQFLQLAASALGSIVGIRYELAGISGSITRKARAKVSAGTVTLQSHLSWNTYVLVQDVGGT